MDEIKVIGIRLAIKAKPNSSGNTILAYFDCEVRGLMLEGCAFVRTAKNGLAVWPPKLDLPNDARRKITIIDSSLRAAMVREAQTAYRMMGGTDGEWLPVDAEDDARRTANHAAAAQRIRDREEHSRDGLQRFLAADQSASNGSAVVPQGDD